MKNMKKYTMEEVKDVACDERLVTDNWPGKRRLTVNDMMKIGLAREVDPADLQLVIYELDAEGWRLSNGNWSDKVLVEKYIALKE